MLNFSDVNSKDPHRRHVFNHLLTNMHLMHNAYYVRDVSPYQISPARLQCFICYLKQTESWWKCSNGRHLAILHFTLCFIV